MGVIRPLLLNVAEVEQAAPGLAEIVELVEETYRMDGRGEVEVPAKIGVHPKGPNAFLHAMPAWVSTTRALGMKWVSFFPSNAEHGLPDSTGLIVLNHPDTGLPVAILEGMWITYARTAACAALAAKYLARPKPQRLGLVGCGGLGTWSLRVLTEVFPSLTEVHVSSVRPESRAAFCEAMQATTTARLIPVDSPRDAFIEMDIVVSSVPKLKENPLKGEWWTPGTLLVPLDVTAVWDDALYQKADHLICDHPENLARAFERYRPGITVDPNRLISVQDVVSGRAGTGSGDSRTIAFMTGISSLDMTLAWEVYRRASSQNLGTQFEFA